MRTVAIAGVGLIGGSFALALRAAGFPGKILGVSSPTTIATATRLRMIDAGVTLDEAAAQSDLILLAQPISIILETIPKLAGKLKAEALVTDAGSTKRRICECAAAHLPPGAFLGGHPMAGKESRGCEAAEAELFRGRPWLVTPSRQEDLEPLRTVEFLTWLKRIGARTIIATAGEHDQWVARSSHVPQLLSTTLAAGLEVREDREAIAGAAGPGLAGMTRLAMSSWPIWADILATNSDSIAAALEEFQADLNRTRSALAAGEMEPLFRQGAKFASKLKRGQ